MKYVALIAMAALTVACSKPDPYDAVRILRSQYELGMDITLSSSGEATYELRARNLSGKTELQEITAIIRLLDKDQKPLWTKQVEIPVAGVGPYATATHQDKAQVGPIEYEFYDIMLAPDGEGSKFKTYKEFMRVVPQ